MVPTLLVHLLGKEKKSLELIISSQQAQEHALKTHIQHLQDELENQDSMVIHNLYWFEYFSCRFLNPNYFFQFEL